MALVLIVAALLFLTSGILAYSGAWRSWAYSEGFATASIFTFTFIGIGALVLAAMLTWPSSWSDDQGEVSPAALFLIGGCALMVVLGFYGLWPAFILQRWFKEERARWREAERAAEDVRRGAKALGEATKQRE